MSDLENSRRVAPRVILCFWALLAGAVVARALPPTVSIPASQATTNGATVVLAVSAGGTGPLAYQWFKNGVALAGATNASLTIARARGDPGRNWAGPSTSVLPFMEPLAPGYSVQSLFSAGDTVNLGPDGATPYRFVGLPDGLGAFDNGDGTFTVLVNHELSAQSGVPRRHGVNGAFVTRLLMSKTTLIRPSHGLAVFRFFAVQVVE
jgi:hypothetical protein